MRGYLVGFMLWLGLSLGCLALLMLQYVTGGLWGLVSRRFLEAAAKCFPLMAILFIPIAVAAPHFYPWIDHTTWWLNLPGFYIRAVIYFVDLDRPGLHPEQLGQALRRRSGAFALVDGCRRSPRPGLLLYVFTITFAAVDWVMSLSPGWTSTIYGLLYLAGQGLSAFAFVIIMLWLVSKHEPYRSIVTRTQVHDIGKLMMAFTLLWAYFSYSQFLITWSGNLPEEIGWYMHRIRGGWAPVAIFIVMFHFFVPFGIMLSQEFKRNLKQARAARHVHDLHAGGGPVLVHRSELQYAELEQPAPFADVQVLMVVVASVIGIGGLWLGFFFFNLRKAPLTPAYDPQMPLLLSMSQHGH